MSLCMMVRNLRAQLLQLLGRQVCSKLCYNALLALQEMEVRELYNANLITHALETVNSSIYLHTHA